MCSTEVDSEGYSIKHGVCGDGCPVGEEYILYGMCGEDPCPQVSNGTNWGTDHTLSVSTHSSYDEEIQVVMAVLGAQAMGLIITAALLKYLSIFLREGFNKLSTVNQWITKSPFSLFWSQN